MGKIIKKRIEYGGSSNSAENIKYDDNKNVKEAIDEVKSDIADVNSNLSTNFPTAWNYPILSSCMINEFDYTYGNEVAQRDAILKLSTNTYESFTYLGLRTALINYSNGKEMILYSGNGDRYGGGIILSNISQKFFKAEKDDITFFDIDSINSNSNNLLIKGYIDKNIGSVQLDSRGYLDIRVHIPTDKTVVLTGIKTFGASTKASGFNITADGSYIIGAGGDLISDVVIRYYYS